MIWMINLTRSQYLPQLDDQLRTTILEAFSSLSNVCRLQPPVPGNAPLYYAKFFDHLMKHASIQINVGVPCRRAGYLLKIYNAYCRILTLLYQH
jgi:hypothetical protein